jgi:hypothetical protein
VPQSSLTFNEYQELSAATDLQHESIDPTVPLLGLAGEIGALIAEFKKKIRPDGNAYVGFEDIAAIEIGDILWYLAALTRRINRSLGQIAASNLNKTRARWLPPEGRPLSSFDDGVPDGERLPRQFDAVFTTVEVDGLIKSTMVLHGEDLGDLIDDNSREPDHYRFHDVFHLAHAAVLGWSPVLRALIKRKRGAKNSVTDRVEDGARAIATEEAVTALIFELAAVWNYFEGAEHVDDGLLAAVQTVTARLEVRELTAAEWELAILTGYAAWRQVRENGQGTLRVDLDARTLEFTPH